MLRAVYDDNGVIIDDREGSEEERRAVCEDG